MKCTVCGMSGTTYNQQKQPVCSKHTRSTAKSPMCPDCGLTMSARIGKFGSFWGCIAYPTCTGIMKI